GGPSPEERLQSLAGIQSARKEQPTPSARGPQVVDGGRRIRDEVRLYLDEITGQATLQDLRSAKRSKRDVAIHLGAPRAQCPVDALHGRHRQRLPSALAIAPVDDSRPGHGATHAVVTRPT